MRYGERARVFKGRRVCSACGHEVAWHASTCEQCGAILDDRVRARCDALGIVETESTRLDSLWHTKSVLVCPRGQLVDTEESRLQHAYVRCFRLCDDETTGRCEYKRAIARELDRLLIRESLLEERYEPPMRYFKDNDKD